jgi:polyisoprenoid-binding protein YceI
MLIISRATPNWGGCKPIKPIKDERNHRVPAMESSIPQRVLRFSWSRTATISILLVNVLAIVGMSPGVRAAETSALLVDIDEDASRIEIAVRLSMGSFRGVLEKYDARIQIAAGDKSINTAALDFDFADLKTGNKRRDKDMLKWMDYENHPTGNFRLEELAAQGEQLEARGTVTIHGVSKPIAFPVTIAVEGEHVTAEGSAKLNFLDFDLKPIRKMLFITVKPEITIDFHLEGRY